LREAHIKEKGREQLLDNGGAVQKRGERLEREDEKDGTNLVFYISHMLCLFGRKFPH